MNNKDIITFIIKALIIKSINAKVARTFNLLKLKVFFLRFFLILYTIFTAAILNIKNRNIG